jgi:hypothetical protein
VVTVKIGTCGIACEVCILYKRKICQGCTPQMSCPIPRCAVEKGIAYCSQCEEFPCKLYDGKPFEVEIEPGMKVKGVWKPYSEIFMRMIRGKLEKHT